MTVHSTANQTNGIFCLPCSYAPPRFVRVALSILGIGTCVGGITIGIMGLSSISTPSWPGWLNKTIVFLGSEGCIGLICGSCVLGSLFTEIGKDPLHSNTQTHKDVVSKFQNMIEIATRIPRIVLSIILDIVLFIPYVVFLIYHRLKSTSTIKDEEIQLSKKFIVLIHGTNSNAGTWEFGKHFLENERYGTVIALNLEENGSVWNDSSKGIDEYAQSVIDRLSALKERSGKDTKFVFIGHSMGGLVASYAAEKLAAQAQIAVEHVFTIATPWQGSPLLDALPDWIKPKRFHQMTEGSNLLTDLVQSVFKSQRSYCAFGSTTDTFVPGSYSFADTTKQEHRYPFLGHLAIVALPFVWLKIRAQLDVANAKSVV